MKNPQDAASCGDARRDRKRSGRSSFQAGLLGLAIALAALPPLAARANPWMDEFDPDACPGDHQGAVAVRVESGYAFRMPAGAFSVRDPLPPPQDASLPPYGCPGNPIVARAVTTVLGHTQFLPEDFIPHREMRRPVALTLYGHDGPMGVLRVWNRNIDEGPSWSHMSCRDEPDGLIEACYSCPPANWSDDKICRGTYEDGRTYAIEAGYLARALPGMHPEGEGLTLTTHCTIGNEDDPARNFARDCSARFALGPDLLVVYGYDGNVVTLPMLPAFDLALRDWIEARRVPELDGPPVDIFRMRRER